MYADHMHVHMRYVFLSPLDLQYDPVACTFL
jgi:hypothetical protein